MTKQTKTTPAIDLLLPSIKIIKDNILIFFILLVIPILLSTQTGSQPEMSQNPTLAELFEVMKAMVTPYAVAGSVLTFFFYPFLTAALHQGTRKSEIDVNEVVKLGSKNYFQLLALLIATVFLVTTGMFLLIVPGIIAIRSFILAPYYLLDSKDSLSVIGALKKSAAQSRPYKWSIYGVIGLMLLFSILSSFGLTGQILGVILGILYTPALALRYREIAR